MGDHPEDRGGPRRRRLAAAMSAVCSAVAAVLPAACGEDRAPTDHRASFVTRDSAGIEIVESYDSLWRGDGWYIDTTDVLLRIGVADGDPRYELFNVGKVRRLPSGGVAVHESGPGGTWIKVFDSEGRYLRQVGRRGGGPGEFTTISTLVPLPGDSLYTYDMIAGRITVFDPEGGVARVERVRPTNGDPPDQLVPLVDESMVGPISWRDAGQVRAERPAVGEGELIRDSLRLMRYDPETNSIARLLTLPASELVQGEPGIRYYLRFGRSAHWAAAGDRVWAGSNDRVEVGAYGSDGRLLRILRAPVLDVPFTEEVVDSVRSAIEELRGAPLDEATERRLNHPDPPEFRPRFSGIAVDHEGNLWLSAFRAPRWIVFDREDRLLGQVESPSGWGVREIGDDWVLAVRQDSLDIQYVEMLRLVKDGR